MFYFFIGFIIAIFVIVLILVIKHKKKKTYDENYSNNLDNKEKENPVNRGWPTKVTQVYNNRRFSNNRGERGERSVNSILYEFKYENDYLLRDIILKNPKNHNTSQIDHILICSRGIFVIETKNYSGLIYGSEDNLYWTQVLAYGHDKNKFYNPIRQNRTHIYIINQILRNKFSINGCVVFTQGNIENIKSNKVYGLNGLSKYISSFPYGVFSDEEVKMIYCKIMRYSDLSRDLETHIDNIHKMESKINNNICPRCGAKLVLRHGKNGVFYGCSNYPRCKFTKKYNQKYDYYKRGY